MEIKKSEGTNKSERKLARLGKNIFLKLWSYPNVYYEKGKELTDLLVVCDNHILIFSDKKIKFDDSKVIPLKCIKLSDKGPKLDIPKDLSLAWERWHKKAILKSIKQLRGAEYRIRNFPNEIFLDPKCTQKLPISIPSSKNMKIHLICIANGATEACKKFFGGKCTSSLQFSTDLYEYESMMGESLFFTTDYDKSKTFAHVFDNFSFTFISRELDTLRDFVDYLEEKEVFIRKFKSTLIYTGEEDLLYNYVKNFDKERNRHTFLNMDEYEKFKNSDTLMFAEEDWEEFKKSPEYLAKKQANKISYIWDKLIRGTAKNILNGTAILEPDLSTHEGAIRYMALENRTARRVLSKGIEDAINSYPYPTITPPTITDNLKIYETLGLIDNNNEQIYFFLQLQKQSAEPYEVYRYKIKFCLEKYGMCLKSKFVSEKPEMNIKRVIGIALEPLLNIQTTYIISALLIDCSQWTDKQQIECERIRKDLKIWRTPLEQINKAVFKEYPDIS
ncbi:MAG: hypothetical protein LBR09_01355 [Endomicrobium sp.]|jgi:hypothetical protein|nr:hypothetical protein [Endomicrobium sp.]